LRAVLYFLKIRNLPITAGQMLQFYVVIFRSWLCASNKSEHNWCWSCEPKFTTSCRVCVLIGYSCL